MATAAQIEANRLNAQKSTGPRTEEGKAQSCRNALSHGLTAMTLPDDDPKAVQARTLQLTEAFAPANGWDHTLIQTLAREDIRMERIRLQQQAHRALLAGRAALCWDEDRMLAAEQLFAGLARRPSLVSRQLRQSKQGCGLLLERWRTLDGTLAAGGQWTAAQRSLALDMLGVDPELRDGRTPLDPLHGGGIDPVAHLRELVRDQIERLERLQAAALNDLDQAEQAVALIGASAPDATEKLYQRYEAASQRRFEWARKQLPSSRPASMPAPASPQPVTVTVTAAAATATPTVPRRAAINPPTADLFDGLPPLRSPSPRATRPGVAYAAVAASPPQRR